MTGVAEARRPFGARLVPIRQLVSPLNGDHSYSNSRAEVAAAAAFYDDQGVVFYLARRPGPGLLPLYRFSRFGSGGVVHALATTLAAGPALAMQLDRKLGYLSRLPRRGLVPLNAWANPFTGMFYYGTAPAGFGPPVLGYQFVGVLGYVVPADR
jgi:hypothetical protein